MDDNVYSDPRINLINLPVHEGDFGTQGINYGIRNASNPYICFMGNDDVIKPEHLETRLLSIKDTDYDFVYHDALVDLKNNKGQIISHFRGGGSLSYGVVGNSEIVYRRQFLLDNNLIYGGGDGHDWHYILNMINAGALYKYYPSTTYHVRHVPWGTADEID